MRHPPRNPFSTGEPYVYPYAHKGRIAGYQVRFKRQKDLEVESISQYFSVTASGGRSEARRAAIRWRNRNVRWLLDRRFKPRFLHQKTGRPRGGMRRIPMKVRGAA